MDKKCTFYLKTPAGDLSAPGFDLVKSDGFVKYNLQWSEWDTAAMGSSGFLQSASAYPAYLGNYDLNTWPNPIQTSAVAGVQANGVTFNWQWDPSLYVAGSLGNTEYFNYWDSPWKDSDKFEIDYGYLMLQYDQYLTSYDSAFAGLNNADYKTKVATFNTAVNGNQDS